MTWLPFTVMNCGKGDELGGLAWPAAGSDASGDVLRRRR
ncbi:hypothetical protein CSC12_6185 (plasmid) [Klebsiella michiganensis]|nr:hypothetical protein CSC12_6185 [Klebsiella michiganensis]